MLCKNVERFQSRESRCRQFERARPERRGRATITAQKKAEAECVSLESGLALVGKKLAKRSARHHMWFSGVRFSSPPAAWPAREARLRSRCD